MLADLEICPRVTKENSTLSDSEKKNLLEQIPSWQIQSGEHEYLYKRFEFKNFKKAQAFVNKVGELAEKANHHPGISFGWGYAEIKWWTHSIGGLHKNDFIMAARIEVGAI